MTSTYYDEPGRLPLTTETLLDDSERPKPSRF
jgi:hypothetical protein